MNTRLRLVAVALAFLMPTAVFARWSLILPELEPAAIPSLSLPAQVGA